MFRNLLIAPIVRVTVFKLTRSYMKPHLSLLTKPSVLPEDMLVSAQLQKRRWRGAAWGVSCLVHGLLSTAALWQGTRGIETPRPTIRLVFAEPPPPPPALSGVIMAAEAPATVQQTPAANGKPKEEQSKLAVVKPKEAARLKIAKRPRKSEIPQPQPQAPMQAVPEPEPTAVESAAASLLSEAVSNVTASVTNGAIGGVSGGAAGGVIGAHGSDPLPVKQVANPPLLLSRVMPEYSRQARLQGVEGLVLLEAVLAVDGHVEDDIKVLQSIPSLDLAAMQALRQWRFRPARDQENRPVRVILEVPMRFVLR